MNKGFSSSTDAELADAIRAANHAAFKALYYRYFEALFRFLCRQTSDEEIAKDILQETFTRMWKNHESLDPGKSIKSYLFRIAYNLVIDHRRQFVHQAEPFEAHAEVESAYVVDEQFELHDKIQSAITSLPEAIRVVFTMHRLDGIKYADIATMLNISIKTVEARMSKALAILREKLAPFLALTILALHFAPIS